jgi:signal transduction histidine kinase
MPFLIPPRMTLRANGLGLGLPLVKRLVELHGGHLSARSEGREMGTEFRILLPHPG